MIPDKRDWSVPPCPYSCLRAGTTGAGRFRVFSLSLARSILHPQAGGGPLRAGHHPAGLAEGAGDELTGKEAAAILSRVTGRKVHYEGFPPDVLRAQSEDIALMFEWFDRAGYSADIKSLRRDFPEVKWQTFEEWARKQDWSVLDQGQGS